MRIATSQIYSSSVATMENQQAQILQVQQQISTGVAISNPADNPLGAAQAVTLSATSATLSQYASNQTTALTALQLEDTTLTSVTTTMQSINSLIIEAQNGSLTDSARQAIAQQMQGDRDQLLTLANTTDGAGNYIFSGFQSTSQVFSNKSGGGVTYNGDAGQRVMQVAGTRTIPVGDTGAAVFQSVQAVGSDIVPSGSASNTGTGVISAVTVTDPTQTTNNDSYTINFVTNPATGNLGYTVTDGSGSPSTPVDFTAGDAIPLGSGMNVTITGTPTAGQDSFTVTPATASQNTDVFATIDSIISALNTPTSGSPAAVANLNNALNTGLTQIGNSLSNVITVQASVGGREQEVKALQTITSTNSLQITSNLDDLTSTDTVAAISQYEQLSNALTASQKSFAATQNLSLFQYINP
ncbi:flagellar hook-associated protein FlgL [Paraburkholderia lycopersici]|uniref:Flagellar hook-associated protein 3 FlgL n=1 Tax=Paraburkholderia lycopersici TaxID=416944 RepID=A0A1G6T144_9BURK|nr:flagellar hook-associated protein FlgL [Paraburkholderia lycopersici]SDD22749.1 flagellar hook-associated protein 3 FlgL [Paraburkholderia lycopersici]